MASMDEGPSRLSIEQVRHVARLAALALTPDEAERARIDLSAVLGYMERLAQVDVEGVEPLVHVGSPVNRLDPDIPGPTLTIDVVMSLAPASSPPFIKVPKVLGDGGGA